MPTTLTGDPRNFPLSVTGPSDGDGPIKAADVVPALQGLMDRSAYLGDLRSRLAALQPLNMVAYDANGGAGHYREAFFDPVAGVWYVCSENDSGSSIVRSSNNLGHSWSDNVSGIGAGEDCFCGAADPATGNVVVATGTRYVFNLVAGSWSKVDAYGGAMTTDNNTRVVWDPINGKFVWMTCANGGAKVMHSPTGAVWTAGTAPMSSSGFLKMAVKPSTGRVVAIARSTTTVWHVRTSDDGGHTWTARADITGVITSADHTSLVYESETNTWLWSVGEVSGTNTSAIYTSTDDGVTWTLLTSFASVCLIGLAVDGASIWCAIALSASFFPRLVYSVDSGVTWKTTGLTLSSTLADVGGVFAGGGRFAVVVGSSARLSFASGVPTTTTVT